MCTYVCVRCIQVACTLVQTVRRPSTTVSSSSAMARLKEATCPTGSSRTGALDHLPLLVSFSVGETSPACLPRGFHTGLHYFDQHCRLPKQRNFIFLSRNISFLHMLVSNSRRLLLVLCGLDGVCNKVTDYSSSQTSLIATGTCVPYGISNTCHLVEVTFPPLPPPINAGTLFSNSGGTQG